jgi:hypothetical protein
MNRDASVSASGRQQSKHGTAVGTQTIRTCTKNDSLVNSQCKVRLLSPPQGRVLILATMLA